MSRSRMRGLMSVGDLQPHRRAEAAAQQLLLHGLEQVLGVVLLDLHVLVAGDAERVVLQHLHAREQLVQVLGDDFLEGTNEAGPSPAGGLHVRGARPARRVDRDEPRQQRRHLDAGEVLLAGGRVAAPRRRGSARAPRCTGTGGPGPPPAGSGPGRSARRKNLRSRSCSLVVQLVPVHQVMPSCGQRRLHLLREHRACRCHEPVRLLADRLEDLPRAKPGRRP